MYSVSNYGQMIADTPRTEAYVTALRRTVEPDSVVVDLGCGPGLFALLACQMGARRVYAIEPDNVIEVARQAAAANGYEDRIEFIQEYSTRVTLPEKADVIISDLRGVLPLFQQHIPAMADARCRLLKPGGVLIPQKDFLWATVVEAPEIYAKISGPWELHNYGLDLNSARRFVINDWRKLRVNPEQFLTEPLHWCVLDYREVEDPDVTAELRWDASRPGLAHGFIMWFDTELFDGIGFSNRPGEFELVYGAAFFPFLYPIDLVEEDEIGISLKADLVGEDYIWRWNTRVVSKQNSGVVKATFKQSTFFGVPLSAPQLHKKSASHVASLNDEGAIEIFILSLMDGKTTLEQIANQLTEKYPNRFASYRNALDHVSEIAQEFTE
jgi:protein arginine N-methyltransferase 1